MAYDDSFIKHALEVLDLNRGNQTKTAKELGIDRTLLNKWKQRVIRTPAILDAESHLPMKRLDNDTQRTIKALKSLKHKAIKVAIDKIDKASPAQAAVIAAIATDKENLLMGKPTSRNESVKVRYVKPESLKEAATKVIVLKRGEYSVGKALSGGTPQPSEFDIRRTEQVVPDSGQRPR